MNWSLGRAAVPVEGRQNAKEVTEAVQTNKTPKSLLMCAVEARRRAITAHSVSKLNFLRNKDANLMLSFLAMAKEQ